MSGWQRITGTRSPLGRRGGFTLFELALVISILGILATAAIPQWTFNFETARNVSEETVIGTVRTGIYLYGNESLATNRNPLYPSSLDQANLGLASPTNSLFTEILSFPIDRDWFKEDDRTYRSPTGQIFAYNPNFGTFRPEDEINDTGDPNFNPFGDLLQSFEGIDFYSSGAIVDQESPLTYNPDYDAETVYLTLVSGTVIQTNEDGSAVVILANGEEVTVPNINNEGFIYFDIPSEDGSNRTYVAVGYGRAQEWENNITFTENTSSYDRSTGTYIYSRAYESEGHYAGGSLSTERGFIYESSHQSEQPTTIQSTWTPMGNGGYRGTTEVSYDNSYGSIYAANNDQGESRWAHHVTQNQKGNSETRYSYNHRTGDYKSRYSGDLDYDIQYRMMDGPDRSQRVHYKYEGHYRHNRKNKGYEGSVRYRYDDGRDFTSKYRYDPKTRTYHSIYRNNVTGEEKRYSWTQ